MSVQNLKATDAWTRATFNGRPQHCFYCGERIPEIAVVWSGHSMHGEGTDLIVLHPRCATSLGIELIGDARTARRILNGKPLLADVDKSLLPQGEA